MVGLNEYYRLSGFVVLARLLVGQLDIGVSVWQEPNTDSRASKKMRTNHGILQSG